MVWHESYSDYMPLVEVYGYVISQLDPNKYDSRQKDKAKKMRHEVLGNDWIGRTPDLFWDVGLLVELGIRPHEWRSKLWHQVDRAKFRAYKFIESMTHIVEKYNTYQKDQRDKLRKGQNKDDGKKRKIS